MNVWFTMAATFSAVGLIVRDTNSQEVPRVRDVTPAGVTRIFQSIPSVGTSASPSLKFESAHLQNDGTMIAGGRVLQLNGVSFPPRTKICGQVNQARWACGLRAYGAARQLIENKTLACDSVDNVNATPASSSVICWIDRKDVALSLLKQGWVFVDEGRGTQKSYLEAAIAARSNHVGVWSDGVPDQISRPQNPLALQ
jgi:endonuclease YncB( thermonuclease family)